MKPPQTVGQTWDQNTIQRYLNEALSKTLKRISFGTPATTSATVSNNEPDRNIQCFKATGTTPAAANTEFVVQHNLPYAPVYFHVTVKGGAIVYQSTSHPTNTAATNSTLGKVYLMCTGTSIGYNLIIL
jgi:hypothetical protein